VMKYSVCR